MMGSVNDVYGNRGCGTMPEDTKEREKHCFITVKTPAKTQNARIARKGGGTSLLASMHRSYIDVVFVHIAKNETLFSRLRKPSTCCCCFAVASCIHPSTNDTTAYTITSQHQECIKDFIMKIELLNSNHDLGKWEL
jgi:hypothetical protein